MESASKKEKANMDDLVRQTGEKLTAEQIKTLRQTFKALDANHDGKISEQELKRACKKLGILLTKDDVVDIMGEADLDGNGYIEYKEFEKCVGYQLLIASYKNKQLQKAFRHFDKDGDGYITADEIKQVLRESGVDFTEEEIVELVAEADENGDGVISFEEFVSTVCEKDW